MSKRKPRPKPPLSRAEFILARLSLFAALIIAAYLGWTSLQGGPIPGCGPESDCDRVLGSRWAWFLGLPVSLLAAPLYAAMLGLLWTREIKWRPLVTGAVLILLAAGWFVGLQFFYLRAFCKFCMAAHVSGGIAAVILLRRNPLPTRPTLAWSAAATAAVLLLAIGQFLASPPAAETTTYAATAANQSPTLANDLVTEEPVSATSTNSATPAPPPKPTYSILGGTIVLDLTTVPVHGDIRAPKKIVKLFDYTCHHCRDMHHHFQPLLERYSNQLAVISLPMPLDASCNHLIKQTPSAHLNACQYAKLGLAVFYADPAKSEAFDDWIFTPPLPPPLEEAHQFASSLVGPQALSQALLDPRIEQQIQQDIAIFLTNSRAARSSKMPQLLFTGGTTVGSSTSVEDLLGILVKNVDLDTNSPTATSSP